MGSEADAELSADGTALMFSYAGGGVKRVTLRAGRETLHMNGSPDSACPNGYVAQR